MSMTATVIADMFVYRLFTFCGLEFLLVEKRALFAAFIGFPVAGIDWCMTASYTMLY